MIRSGGFNRNHHNGELSGMDSFGEMFNTDGSFPDITWNNTTNMTISSDGHSLVQSGGADDDWTVRNPYSDQIGDDTVWSVTFRLLDQYMKLGCTNLSDVANNPFFMDFSAYRTETGGQVVAYENNVAVATLAQAPGDALDGHVKIVSDGVDVKYYYDNVLKYTSLESPIAIKLKAGFFKASGMGAIITDLSL